MEERNIDISGVRRQVPLLNRAWSDPNVGAWDLVKLHWDVATGGTGAEDQYADVLTLHYPAYGERIKKARAAGFGDEEIRRALQGREGLALLKFPAQQVNSALGRTPETMAAAARAERRQLRDAYVKASEGRYTGDEVDERLKASELLGVPAATLLNEPELYKGLTKEIKMREGRLTTFLNGFQRNRINRAISREGMAFIYGAAPDEAMWGRVEALEKEARKYAPPMLPSFMQEGLGGASEQMGLMMDTFTTAFPYMMAGAGMAALAGNASPLAALPEEVVTVPAAAGMGYAAGSTIEMFQREAGGAAIEFLRMKDENGNPMDPVAARTAAVVVGAVNAAIERLQFETFFRMFKGGDAFLRGFSREGMKKLLVLPTVRKALREMALDLGKGITSEVIQEVAQEAVTILGGEVAKGIAGLGGQFGFEALDWGQTADRLWETAAQTAKTQVVMAGIPAAFNTAGMALDIRRIQRGFNEQAQRAGIPAEALLRGINGELAQGEAADGVKIGQVLRQDAETDDARRAHGMAADGLSTEELAVREAEAEAAQAQFFVPWAALEAYEQQAPGTLEELGISPEDRNGDTGEVLIHGDVMRQIREDRPELYSSLAMDIRRGHDGVTWREASRIIESRVQKDPLWQTQEVKDLQERLKGQAIEAGRPEQEAEDLARMAMAFGINLHRRAGIPVENALNLFFKGPQAEARQQAPQAEAAGQGRLYNGFRLPFDPKELRTESGRGIGEAAASEMLMAPDGSRTLGVIRQEFVGKDSVFPAGEIRANAGAIHYIENTHGKELRRFGYDDAQTLLLDVLNNYTDVRRGDGNALILSTPGLTDKRHSAKSVVELVETEPGVYYVKDAGIVRTDYITKKELLSPRVEIPGTGPDSGLAYSPGRLQDQGTSDINESQQSNSDAIIAQDEEYSQIGEIARLLGYGEDPDIVALLAAALENPGESYEQRAWHGTPHEFARFLLKYIGTGEGAQAFGWGLYFAESRGIAEWYREVLSSPTYNYTGPHDIVTYHLKTGETLAFSNNAWMLNGEAVPKTIQDILSSHADKIVYHNQQGTLAPDYMENVVRDIKKEAEASIPKLQNHILEMQAKMDDLRAQKEAFPDPEDPRGWQLNFSLHDAEQNLKSLKKALAEEQEMLDWFNAHDISGAEVASLEEKKGALYEVEIPENDVLLDWDAPLDQQPDVVSKAIEEGLTLGIKADTGETFYRLLSGVLGGDKEASLWLKERGVLGLRYWDRGSRNKGEGTHNFVIWDEDAIQMIEAYEQAIGERGAAALDKTDAGRRMEDLNVARQMEQAGRDAKAIRLATGWERGADGKWRFEIMDGEFSWDGFSTDPEILEHRALTKKVQSETFTQEEFKRRLALGESIYKRGLERQRHPSKLEDFYDSPELYAAYPELRDVNVKLARGYIMPHGAWAMYDPDKNLITLREDMPVSTAREKLIHEIQHAVQCIEGFAVGETGEMDIETYRRVSFEVEARNTETRANMTAEERRASLLADTEDVAREDQIILREALGVAESREMARLAPNGQPSNLSARQWDEVRTPAFKDFFGDWETAAAAREIQDMQATPVTLSGKKLTKKEAEARAASFGEIENKRYGVKATISNATIGKIVGHKGFNVTQIIDDLPGLFRNSVLVLSEPELQKPGHKKHSNIRAYHHFVSKFTADGTEYYIRFTAYEENTKRPTGKRIVHSTAISEIAVYVANQRKTLSRSLSGLSTPGVAGQASFVDTKIAQVLNSVNDASKVVDANGEPLVVYHGSSKWFTVFNDGTQRKQSNAPDGSIFFTDNREIANSFIAGNWYGKSDGAESAQAENVIADPDSPQHKRTSWGVYRKGGIYPVYLNIKNPLVLDYAGRAWNDSLTRRTINDDVAEAKRAGYDGVIVKNVRDVGATDLRIDEIPPSTVYVAFDSNQVKSATGNAGTFDRTNPDIYKQDRQTGQDVETVNARTTWAKGTKAWESESLVEFFRTANPSTGFHELAHHMLRVLVDVSEMEGAKQEIIGDVETVLRHAGVTREQWKSDERARRRAHEFFARSFETYLAEGTAPTKELKGAFRRIRQWMIEVYHDVVQALGIELSDEMRGVFDRLLATPEEIDANAQIRELALEEATAREEIRRVEAELRERAAQERDEAEWSFPELSDDALEAVDGWLAEMEAWENRRGEREAVENVMKIIRDNGGLRLADLVHELGEALAGDLRDKWPGLFRNVTQNPPLTLDVLAQQLEAAGLRLDVNGLIQWLQDTDNERPARPAPLAEINADTLNALIDRLGAEGARKYLTDRSRYLTRLQKQLQAEYERDKGNPEVRGDLEATYREQREIAESVKALERVRDARDLDSVTPPSVLDGTPPPQGEATARGSRQEQMMTLAEALRQGYAMAEKYTREAYRAGRNAGREAEAARLGARIDRLRARIEMLSKVKPEIQKLLSGIRRMADSENIMWDRRQEIRELLEGYDLKRRSAETLARRAELAEYLNERPEEQGNLREEKYLLTVTLGEMSLEDLRELHARVQELHGQGAREFQIWEAERRERIDTKHAELRGALEKRKVKRPVAVGSREDKGKQYRGITGRAAQAKDWLYAATLGRTRFMDWLDGGRTKYDGAFVRHFDDDMNAGLDEALRNVFRRRQWVEDGLRRLGFRMGDFQRVAAEIDGKKWTWSQIMEIYLGMRNEKKAAAILYGNFVNEGKYSPEQARGVIGQLIGMLTDEHRQAAELVVQDHEMNFDRINRALIRALNRGMEHETDYTSIRRLEHFSPQGIIDANDERALSEGMTRAAVLQRVETGFMQKRAEIGDRNQTAVHLDLWGNWLGDVSRHEHAASLASPAGELAAALMQRDPDGQTLGKMIKDRFGDGAWRTLASFFNDAASDTARTAHDLLDKTSAFLARNMTVTYLAGNLATAVKQTASFPRFLITAGPHRLFYNLARFAANPAAFMERVYELSPQTRDRAGNEMLRMIREDPEWGARWYQRGLDWLMSPIALVDRVTVAIGWQATYDANVKKLGHEGAVKAADRAVKLTQPLANARDKNRLWRGSRLMRLAMMFTSDASQTWGMTAYDFVQQVTAPFEKGYEGKWSTAAKGFWTFVTMTLTAVFIRALSGGVPEDEDDEEGWGDFIRDAFTEQSILSLPVIGKEAMLLYDQMSGKYRGTHYSAIVAPMEKMMRAWKLWRDEDSEEEEQRRAAWLALEALSLAGVVRFPTTGARRAVQSAMIAEGYGFGGALKNLIGWKPELEE